MLPDVGRGGLRLGQRAGPSMDKITGDVVGGDTDRLQAAEFTRKIFFEIA